MLCSVCGELSSPGIVVPSSLFVTHIMSPMDGVKCFTAAKDWIDGWMDGCLPGSLLAWYASGMWGYTTLLVK